MLRCWRAEGAPIVVSDQVNQVDPVHQVNKVDEVHQVHQVDPVHHVNEIDEVQLASLLTSSHGDQ